MYTNLKDAYQENIHSIEKNRAKEKKKVCQHRKRKYTLNDGENCQIMENLGDKLPKNSD